jgi:ubiquinone/menaquinone biosynthesis C-methylase UbiE
MTAPHTPEERRRQHELVRERFTRTVEQFGQFSLSVRAVEAERLARLAMPYVLSPARATALDVACGPGTFTLAFAPRVRRICGLDLTLAFLPKAREAAARKGILDVFLLCGQGEALPWRAASFDIVLTAYSLHHFAAPEKVLAEMHRVLKPNGVLALCDLIVPGNPDPQSSAANNAIEIARDASHVRTLFAQEVRALAEAAGFSLRSVEVSERLRSFTDWMQIAGWKPGDAPFAETRRLMEKHQHDDRSGFLPRAVATGQGPDIEFIQTSLFLAAQK